MNSTHYVVRALSVTKSGHTLISLNKPISYSSVRDYFIKASFKDIIPDISLLSTPSLRAGGASAVLDGRMSLLSMTMLMTVWIRDCQYL